MEETVMEVVDLKKKMKRKKVGLVVVLWRKEMEVVVGYGGKEAWPPEMGSSPATWPEVVGRKWSPELGGRLALSRRRRREKGK